MSFWTRKPAPQAPPAPPLVDDLLPVLPALARQCQQMREELARLYAQIVAVGMALERAETAVARVEEQVQTRLAPAEFTHERRQRGE